MLKVKPTYHGEEEAAYLIAPFRAAPAVEVLGFGGGEMQGSVCAKRAYSLEVVFCLVDGERRGDPTTTGGKKIARRNGG